MIIDRSKIRREREKSRKSTEKFEFSENEKWGLYFDGKIDQTYTMEKDELSETHHRRKIAEDHIALIKEPGSKYLAYAAPKSGKAEEVCETLIDKLIEYKAPLEQLRVIGSDGTNVNTGSKGGIIRYVTLHSTLYRTENLRIHYVRSSYKNIDRLVI